MLEVHYKISLKLKKDYNINSSFYISDYKNYLKFKKKFPEFEKNENILFEWELTDSINEDKIDFNYINYIQEEYFNSSPILEAFSSDRRIYLGPKSKFFQDYKNSYSIEEIYKILIASVKKIEDLILKNHITNIYGFTTATFGEILIYKISNKKNINFFHLRHTKIGKNYTYSKDLYEYYSDIRKTFTTLSIKNYDEKNILNLISSFKNKGIEYEGRVGSDLSILNLIKKMPIELGSAIYNYIKYFSFGKDNHYKINFIKIYLYDRLLRVLNSKFQSFYFKKKFLNLNNSNKNFHYIYYPLHAEPEISVSIFSPFYENQIEVIRNISKNLPAKYKLIVKEHPRNIGRRKLGYYKKILSIPNVVFCSPFENSRKIILKCDLCIVLSGFIAFEAIMLGRPVLSLGNAMYNMLPKTMINNIENIKYIYQEINYSLKNFRYDEQIIYKYLKSILINSNELELYTVLLKKKGRSGGEKFTNELYNKNIDKVYKMIIKTLNVNS